MNCEVGLVVGLRMGLGVEASRAPVWVYYGSTEVWDRRTWLGTALLESNWLSTIVMLDR